MTELYPMLGKNVLVTGATAGIGEEVATRLYSMGAHVILHGRNPVRVAATIDRIQKKVNDERTGRLDILTANFEDMQQVYEMAEAFKKRYQRLDVLINNAGAIFLRRQETASGIEKTFAVNYLAHFLLTTRLLDVIKASAPARVINISSGAHHQAKLNYSDMMMKENYHWMTAYGNSKLYGLLFTYELARRFRRNPELALTANAVNPGLVVSQMGMNNGVIARVAIKLLHHLPLPRIRPRPTAEGADTIVYLASEADAAAFNGKYFVDRKVEPTSVPSYDHDAAFHIWGVSEMMVQRYVPALQRSEEPQ